MLTFGTRLQHFEFETQSDPNVSPAHGPEKGKSMPDGSSLASYVKYKLQPGTGHRREGEQS